MGFDIAAERFGHDINYYVNTYGKLTDEQKIDRFKAHYGEAEEEKEEQPKPILCNICDTINEPKKEFCEKCNSPLSLKKALEVEKAKEDRIKILEEKEEKHAEIIGKIFNHPFFKKLDQAKKIKIID